MIQFNMIQFNMIQFNSIQFNSIQFNSDNGGGTGVVLVLKVRTSIKEAMKRLRKLQLRQ